MVKLDVVTLLTVPDDPPAAGPDRALDPPPAAGPPVALLPAVVEGAVAVVEEAVVQPAASPITAHVTAATVHPRRLFRARDVAPETGAPGEVPWGIVESLLFMMALLLPG
jgi:hypothetical protein